METDPRSRSLRFNANNRRVFLDLARLELADYLWASDDGRKVDVQVLPELDHAQPASVASDFGRVKVFAEALMEETWGEVSADIDSVVAGEEAARKVKKRLANHVWCGMLVGLIQLLEGIDEAVGIFTDAAKQSVTSALLRHFDSGISRRMTEAVIGFVVDRVWSALEKLLAAHFPLLGEDTLRVLRVLAVFTCPSVERHRAVYEHALKPLLGDARELVAENVQTPLVTLFAAWWQRPGAEPAG